MDYKESKRYNAMCSLCRARIDLRCVVQALGLMGKPDDPQARRIDLIVVEIDKLCEEINMWNDPRNVPGEVDGFSCELPKTDMIKEEIHNIITAKKAKELSGINLKNKQNKERAPIILKINEAIELAIQDGKFSCDLSLDCDFPGIKNELEGLGYAVSVSGKKMDGSYIVVNISISWSSENIGVQDT